MHKAMESSRAWGTTPDELRWSLKSWQGSRHPSARQEQVQLAPEVDLEPEFDEESEAAELEDAQADDIEADPTEQTTLERTEDQSLHMTGGPEPAEEQGQAGDRDRSEAASANVATLFGTQQLGQQTPTPRRPRLATRGRRPKPGAPKKRRPRRKRLPFIESRTVANNPGTRTRVTLGVGEEVDLTYSERTAKWSTTAGKLSRQRGKRTRLTAPDAAGSLTVTADKATLNFTIIAPTGVHMDRYPGTKIRHTKDRPDSGIQTLPYLLPDTVNFYRVQYHEVDVGAVCTGVYTPFNGIGHDPHPATVSLSTTVVAGKGTRANARDSVYSGDPGTPAPFVPGHILFNIPYEFKVGSGAFSRFVTVAQNSDLAADASSLSSSKAGATGSTTVASPTSAF